MANRRKIAYSLERQYDLQYEATYLRGEEYIKYRSLEYNPLDKTINRVRKIAYMDALDARIKLCEEICEK